MAPLNLQEEHKELVMQIEHLKESALVQEARAAEEIDRAQQAVAERAEIEDASARQVCKQAQCQACVCCMHARRAC
jgi:hypothetical protein